MEPEDFLEKKSNFFLHGFSRYLTPNMALQKIILTFQAEQLHCSASAEQLRCSASYVYFGTRTTWVTKDFFTPKRFESRPPHFSTRQNMEPEDFLGKKIKFFSLRVFQIFDSKHGSPENYSDFFLS